MKTADLVFETIKPLFDGDIQLVEVEYVKKYDNMHLIVYIDKIGGITLEDCESVSKMIDPVIEQLNPTKDASYCLDVSSYGIDKPLKYDWQFDNYLDKMVTVKLYKKVNIAITFKLCIKLFKIVYLFVQLYCNHLV